MLKSKEIKSQPSRHNCIYSPFEELVPIFREGKSAFADAEDVITKTTKFHLTLTTLSLLLCLFISSCSKTANTTTTGDTKASCVPTVLPPYTETGSNNIAFTTIDGQVWVNNLCYFDNFLQPQAYKSSVFYHQEEHIISINAKSYPNSSYSDQFTIEIPTIKLTDKSLHVGFIRGAEDMMFANTGYKPPLVKDLRILKFDTINKIYSGKYDITLFKLARSLDKRDSIHIIGFFDCKEGQFIK